MFDQLLKSHPLFILKIVKLLNLITSKYQDSGRLHKQHNYLTKKFQKIMFTNADCLLSLKYHFLFTAILMKIW